MANVVILPVVAHPRSETEGGASSTYLVVGRKEKPRARERDEKNQRGSVTTYEVVQHAGRADKPTDDLRVYDGLWLCARRRRGRPRRASIYPGGVGVCALILPAHMSRRPPLLYWSLRGSAAVRGLCHTLLRSTQPQRAVYARPYLSALYSTPSTYRIWPPTTQESARLAASVHAVRLCLQQPDDAATWLPAITARTQALRKELDTMYAPSHEMDELLWHDLVMMYMHAAEQLSLLDAVRVYLDLASLAPPAMPVAKARDVGLHLLLQLEALPDRSHMRAMWKALCKVGDPTPSDTTPLTRRLILSNRLGEAMRILQWHIQQHWLRQAPAPSRAVMHTLMIQMRTVERVLRLRTPPSPGRFGASRALYTDYCYALVALGSLLRENYLPLVPAHKEDITWLIQLLAHFPALEYHAPHAAQAAQEIRHVLPVWIERLPCGRTPQPDFFTPPPQRTRRSDRATYFVPVLSERSYNALLQYTLQHTDNPQACWRVLEHMTRERSPPLKPGPVTVNILVRQAARRRWPALGSYALALQRADPSAVALPALPAPTASMREAEPLYLLASVDEALRDHDTYRLVALLQHIRHSQLRSPQQPHGIRATSVLLRVYPELRRKRTWPSAPIAHHPHVYVASLQLAAAAGHINMAMRIWRLLKQMCIAHRQPVPTQAMVEVLRLLVRVGRRRRWVYARHEHERDSYKTQACMIALQEYAWLLHHWSALGTPPEVDVYVALLRLLRRIGDQDAAYARVVDDIYALGLASIPRLQQALSTSAPRSFPDTHT